MNKLIKHVNKDEYVNMILLLYCCCACGVMVGLKLSIRYWYWYAQRKAAVYTAVHVVRFYGNIQHKCNSSRHVT